MNPAIGSSQPAMLSMPLAGYQPAAVLDWKLPESKPVLEINVDHPLVERLSAEADQARFGELAEIVLDHALLAEGTQLANPADYVRRMNQLLLNIDAED